MAGSVRGDLAGVVTAIVLVGPAPSTHGSLPVRNPRMGIAEHDPRRWNSAGTWTVESSDAALARTPEFGRRFFEVVYGEITEAAGAYFPRWSEQPDDVYAVFDLREVGAGVQIDPAVEYIIAWERTGRRIRRLGHRSSAPCG